MSDLSNQPLIPSEELLHKLVDSLAEMVCALDAEGRFLFVNKASYKILGYQPEELIGVCCFNLIVEEDLDASINATRDTQLGARISTFENRYYHKEGHIVTMLWEGSWNFGENVIYATGRDISEQRRLENMALKYHEQLEQTKRQLEGLVNRISDGFFALDENAIVIYWNKAAEEIAHLTQEQMIGHSLWEVLPEPTNRQARQQFDIIQKQNRPLYIEYFSERVQRWIEVNAYISGSGVSVFFRDVTERKSLQEQLLREKEERIAEKEQEKRKITTAVITATEEERALVGRELHDNINQVLTTVKLYNELCRDGIGNIAEIMDKSIILLQQSINDIRNLSKRLSAPSLGNIKLKESVTELVEATKATNKMNINLDISKIDDLEVDQELHLTLYRIIQEHLTNVLRHSAAENVWIELDSNAGQLQLLIKDDGKGFDLMRNRGGSGITNMITRAESKNGVLNIQSTPGQGCTLEVQLPL